MMSLDMTGEDTAKTGGTFLIEKQARSVGGLAAAVRIRTASGATGKVEPSSLRGQPC